MNLNRGVEDEGSGYPFLALFRGKQQSFLSNFAKFFWETFEVYLGYPEIFKNFQT
jgi:hypothetical protein